MELRDAVLARIDQFVTRRAYASHTGIHEAVISRFIAGTPSRPTGKMLADLAQYLLTNHQVAHMLVVSKPGAAK